MFIEHTGIGVAVFIKGMAMRSPLGNLWFQDVYHGGSGLCGDRGRVDLFGT